MGREQHIICLLVRICYSWWWQLNLQPENRTQRATSRHVCVSSVPESDRCEHRWLSWPELNHGSSFSRQQQQQLEGSVNWRACQIHLELFHRAPAGLYPGPNVSQWAVPVMSVGLTPGANSGPRCIPTPPVRSGCCHNTGPHAFHPHTRRWDEMTWDEIFIDPTLGKFTHDCSRNREEEALNNDNKNRKQKNRCELSEYCRLEL